MLLTEQFLPMKILEIDKVVIDQLICETLEVFWFLHNWQSSQHFSEVCGADDEDITEIIYAFDQSIKVFFESAPLWLVPIFEVSRNQLRVFVDQPQYKLWII